MFGPRILCKTYAVALKQAHVVGLCPKMFPVRLPYLCDHCTNLARFASFSFFQIGDFGTSRWTQHTMSTGLATFTIKSSRNTQMSLAWSAPEVRASAQSLRRSCANASSKLSPRHIERSRAELTPRPPTETHCITLQNVDQTSTRSACRFKYLPARVVRKP